MTAQLLTRGYILTRTASLCGMIGSVAAIGTSLRSLHGGDPIAAFKLEFPISVVAVVALSYVNAIVFTDRPSASLRRMVMGLMVAVHSLMIVLFLAAVSLMFRLNTGGADFVGAAFANFIALSCVPFSVVWLLRYRREGGPDHDAVTPVASASPP